ncbi:MAG: peptidase M64, partial [Bacteroidales bacterium]|nr:peptidase M64 [Bacteroidales bacterium]
MKRIVLSALSAAACIVLQAQERTLRIDYSFSGTATEAVIAVDEIRSIDGWAGRKSHRDSLLLAGNGQITMRSPEGTVLYRNSFSTLFQEWQNTEEATKMRRSFENVFLLPMPSSEAEVTIELFDNHGRISASLTHPVNPADILIRPAQSLPEVRDIRIGGPVEDCI